MKKLIWEKSEEYNYSKTEKGEFRIYKVFDDVDLFLIKGKKTLRLGKFKTIEVAKRQASSFLTNFYNLQEVATLI